MWKNLIGMRLNVTRPFLCYWHYRWIWWNDQTTSSPKYVISTKFREGPICHFNVMISKLLQYYRKMTYSTYIFGSGSQLFFNLPHHEVIMGNYCCCFRISYFLFLPFCRMLHHQLWIPSLVYQKSQMHVSRSYFDSVAVQVTIFSKWHIRSPLNLVHYVLFWTRSCVIFQSNLPIGTNCIITGWDTYQHFQFSFETWK